MDRSYALAYRDLFQRHWWWRARERLVLRTLQELRPERNWGSILDVGCGDGLFFDRLMELGDVDGVEMDPSAVADDRWRDRIQIRPFDESFQPEKRYSLVLMLDVLEHFPEPSGSLRRAAELLEPGGVCLMTVPAFNLLWTSHDVLNHHYTRYTKRTLADLVRKAGLTTKRSHYFFYWTFGLKALLHWKERIVPGKPRLPRVPPQWINKALLAISQIEQSTVGRLSVPFGSSLLLVAERANGRSTYP